MNITVNHQGSSYTFKLNCYEVSNHLSLIEIRDNNKLIFASNGDPLNESEEVALPPIPAEVIAKAQNQLKVSTQVGINTNSSKQSTPSCVEVVDFNSVIGSIAWESIIYAKGNTTTVEGEDGEAWTEDAGMFYCSGAIGCYQDHEDIRSITITNDETKIKAVLDLSDWTITIHRFWGV